jgi:hypothetical protein
MSKVVDIIFEVVFPEIAAHVPVGGGVIRSFYE